MHRDTLKRRAKEAEERLQSLTTYRSETISDISWYRTHEHLSPADLSPDLFEPCDVGVAWERDRTHSAADRASIDADLVAGAPLFPEMAVGQHVWFRLQFSIPETFADRPVYFRFVAKPVRDDDDPLNGDVRAEALCYRDGEPWQAFDNAHADLRLTDDADGGETFDLLVEVGSTTLWGNLDIEEFELTTASIWAEREKTSELARYIDVLNDYWQQLPEDSPNRNEILQAVSDASHAYEYDSINEGTRRQSATEALDILESRTGQLTSELTGHELTAAGHAHLDLAWLWPWSETVKKGGRTAATMLKLLDEDADFHFIQSQPHLYEFVRNQYPTVFDRIENRIEEDRWTPTGALWVEADLNLSGGEALARQYLLGKRYFRDRFGVDPKITFLPDVFGFNAALPGIAQAADCPYFLSLKMSWNEINEFPHTTFNWTGIDGSTVLAHFPPAETYNGKMTVDEVTDSVRDLEENDRLNVSAYPVGWGDGGGGTTREMLRNRDIINRIGALPDVSFGPLSDVFDRFAQERDHLETWTGELYLEKHRGTLTTQGNMKRYNRAGEFALREAEIWSALAHASISSFEYDHETLERAWKHLLFNQFHDILPGSSIAEVYADAERDYEEMLDLAEGEQERALTALLDYSDQSMTFSVTNSLNWSRHPVVAVDDEQLPSELVGSTAPLEVRAVEDTGTAPAQRTDDGIIFAAPEVPPCGIATVEVAEAEEHPETTISVSERHVENQKVRVDIADDGTVSVFDKETKREVLDGQGNILRLYQDHPSEFDAWDIEADIYEVSTPLPDLDGTEVVNHGPVRGAVTLRWTFGESKITQTIMLTRDSKCIDFDTEVDWHERETLLKAHFPVDVQSNVSTYEVQYGHYDRQTHTNTSWDQARYEEPHQKWVDVAEHGFGAAVLNDGKYGVHVDGTDIGLTLLRAPEWPDPEADRGIHEFTYSFRPHTGGFRDAGVIRDAYELNTTDDVVPVTNGGETSLLDIDTDGIVVEAVKRSEDDPQSLVVRLYEAWGRKTEATLSLTPSIKSATEVNLIEDERTPLDCSGEEISISLNPFEILSVKVKLGR